MGLGFLTSIFSFLAGNGGNTDRTVLVVAVPIVSAIILVASIFILLRCRKRKHFKPLQRIEGEWLIIYDSSVRFDDLVLDGSFSNFILWFFSKVLVPLNTY